MGKQISIYEIKKLITIKWIWLLLLISVSFNGLLIGSHLHGQESRWLAEASPQTGVKVDHLFSESLLALSQSDKITALEGAYFNDLYHRTLNLKDPLEDYDVEGVGQAYTQVAGYKGFAARLMASKYQSFACIIAERAESDEALSLYFAGDTYDLFHFLFKDLLGAIGIESILIMLLLVFSSFEGEQSQEMNALIASSRYGRKAWLLKGGLALLVGIFYLMVLVIVSLGIYFALNPYHEIINSSVSSTFNYMNDFIVGARPFVTWESLSVKAYLFKSLGIMMGLNLIMGLLAIAFNFISDHFYFAFLSLLVVNGLTVAIPLWKGSFSLPQNISTFFMLSPMWLWLKRAIWFTDGDVDIIWPHFETLGTLAMTVLALLLLAITWQVFRKREIK